MRERRNVRTIGTAATLAAVALLSGRVARADEPTLLSVDEAVTKLANGSPLLVLSAKEGTDEEE